MASSANLQHLAERILGLAGEALLPLIVQGHLAKADPAHHAADEAMPLRHAVELVERPAAHEPEVAGIDGDLDVDEAVEQPIEQDRGELLERRLAAALAALPVDDVRALVHQLHHAGEELWRVLQVRVDDQDALAAAYVQARRQRQLVAVVARQAHADDVGVVAAQLADDRPGAIGRPVVHQHDLVVFADLGAAGIAQAAVQLAQRSLLVVARRHNGELRRRCGQHSPNSNASISRRTGRETPRRQPPLSSPTCSLEPMKSHLLPATAASAR